MKGRRETLVVIVGVLLLAFARASTVAQTPANKAQQSAPPNKLIAPFKGDIVVEMTTASTAYEGNLLVTKFKVKNMATGPVVGLNVTEYWYNAKGDPVSASQKFRAPRLMPGEIVDVTLKSPRAPDMARKLTTFDYPYGKVKPKQVSKFSS